MVDEILYEVTTPKTLLEMSWAEVDEALKENNIVIVMVGSIEQHGPHLPLGADALKMPIYAKKVAKKLAADGIKVVIGPLIPFGLADHHMGFPGTISLTPDTFMKLVTEVCENLINHGFKKICIMNGHGGNASVLLEIVRELGQNEGVQVIFPDMHVEMDAFFGPEGASKSPNPELERFQWQHGGETETSRMLYAYPNLVMMDRAKDTPWPDKRFDKFKDRYLKKFTSYSDLSDWGSVGTPSSATIEGGKFLFNATVEYTVEVIKRELL